jgi:cell division protein FtsL
MTQNELSQQTNNIELLANQVVEGFIIGLHKSPFHGFSVEFAEHKLFNNGDPIKNIDWKVYGRTDKLFSKKFEEETNLRCQIIIDCSSSMYFPQTNGIADNSSKIKFAVVAAASFQKLMKKQRDAVGLSLFNSEVFFHSDAKSSSIQHQIINNELQKLILTPQVNQPSKTAKALHESNLFHGHISQIRFSFLQCLQIILLCAVLLSSIVVVYCTNQYRMNLSQLEHAKQEASLLELQWGQLLLEQASIAAPSRVQERAEAVLHMVTPSRQQSVVYQM